MRLNLVVLIVVGARFLEQINAVRNALINTETREEKGKIRAKYKKPLMHKSSLFSGSYPSTPLKSTPKSPKCPLSFQKQSLENPFSYVSVYENNVRLAKFLCSNQSGVFQWMWEKDPSGTLPRAPMPEQVIVLGLERKGDQRAFMRKKLSSERFNGRFFAAVDCVNDDDCLTYHTNLLKLSPPKQIHLKNVSLAAVGLLYSWRSLFATMIKENVPHMILLESDVYFSNFDRVKAEWKYIISHYMVHMGGHHSIHSDAQYQNQEKTMNLKVFSHYKAHIDINNLGTSRFKPLITFGTYGLIISRPTIRIIFFCLNWILQEPDRFLPVDWIDDIIMTYLHKSTPVMYPNVVVPETRESDNLGPRSITTFGFTRHIDYSNAKHVNDYFLWNEMGKLAMESLPNELWGVKNILGDNLTHLNKFGKDFMYHTTMFAVVLTVYNVESVIHRAIESVCTQTYPYYRLIIFDDCSSDLTKTLIQKSLSLHAICNRRSILLSGPKRFGQSFARQASLKYVHDSEVVVFLDGDDYFASKSSLSQLEEIFQNPSRWPLSYFTGMRVKPLMTYGNFVRIKDSKVSNVPFNVKYFPREVVENNGYRNYSWITHHPRVALGWLAKSVPDTAVMDWNCNWLMTSSDLAQSMYMLEHSGGASTRTNITLYVHNYDYSLRTPDSFYRLENKQFQLQIQNWVRGNFFSPNTGKSIYEYIVNDTCKDEAEKDLKFVLDFTFLLNNTRH